MTRPHNIFEDEIGEMQPGLDRAVLRVLSYHVGKENAISKMKMVDELGKLGFGLSLRFSTFERQIRAVIVELRKGQHLICSSSGDGGYFISANRSEYDEFAQVEYRSKIIDMADTLRAMDEAAQHAFGRDVPAEQGRLL